MRYQVIQHRHDGNRVENEAISHRKKWYNIDFFCSLIIPLRFVRHFSGISHLFQMFQFFIGFSRYEKNQAIILFYDAIDSLSWLKWTTDLYICPGDWHFDLCCAVDAKPCFEAQIEIAWNIHQNELEFHDLRQEIRYFVFIFDFNFILFVIIRINA